MGTPIPPIVDDIGILSSEESMAIHQASVDWANREAGNRTSKLPGPGNLEKMNFELSIQRWSGALNSPIVKRSV